MGGPRPGRQGRPLWAYAVLAAYLVAMLLLVTWPDATPLTTVNLWLRALYIRLGAPASLSSGFWEFVHNVLVCLPPTAAAMLLWRRSRWWHWTLVAGVLSVGVELVQARYLADRTPQLDDVAANTLGAMAGSLVGLWWRARSDERERREAVEGREDAVS